MPSRLIVALALALAGAFACRAEAGLNLGMKLACKRYGEAWNSGSKAALRGVATPDFVHMFYRMPAEQFARLPRGGGSKVIGSRKGRGWGTVTVATSQGALTFMLRGRGFKWTVTDIHKRGDDGRTVSLKSYLDASLTAREFLVDLKYRGGNSFYDSISHEFRGSFRQLSRTDLNRVRNFLPDINSDVKPYLSMNGRRATMSVRMPNGGPNDRVRFSLVQQNGWKVDDYAIDSDRVTIPSFRNALPVIACVAEFGEFVNDPDRVDPCAFTACGKLRDELVAARSMRPFPIETPKTRDAFVVDQRGRSVQVRYPEKTVRMRIGEEGGKRVICQIQLLAADRWADLGHLLAMKRGLRSMSVATVFQSFLQREPSASEVAVANAVAEERETEEKPAIADAQVAQAVEVSPTPEATDVRPAGEKAVEPSRRVIRYRRVQPVIYVYPSNRYRMPRRRVIMRRYRRW
jgi:hypothetical protein